MSDYLIDIITGTKEQEDLIWKMVKVAKKYSDKSELELSEIIRLGLQKLAFGRGNTLKEMGSKNFEERQTFFEESIERLVPSLGLKNEAAAIHDAKIQYREWMKEQLQKKG